LSPDDRRNDPISVCADGNVRVSDGGETGGGVGAVLAGKTLANSVGCTEVALTLPTGLQPFLPLFLYPTLVAVESTSKGNGSFGNSAVDRDDGNTAVDGTAGGTDLAAGLENV